MSKFQNAFANNLVAESNLHTIKFSRTINEEVNMRRIHEVTTSGQSLILMSDPGLTKTETIRHYGRLLDEEYKSCKAEDNDFPFSGAEVYLLDTSVLEITDFNGLPSRGQLVDDNGKPYDVAVYLAMPWVQHLIENVKQGIVTILFLDELSNQNPEIQAPLLSLVLNLIVNSMEFDRNMVRVVGAMNPAQTSVNPVPLKPAFNNRVVKMPFVFNYEYWATGMRANFGKPQTHNESQWRKLIVRFLNDSPSNRYKLPAEVTGRVVNNYSAYQIVDNDYTQMEIMDTQWPSYRSWDLLASVLSVVPFGDTTEETLTNIHSYANGTVGYEAGFDFIRHYRMNSTRKFEDIKKDVLGDLTEEGDYIKYEDGEWEGYYQGNYGGLIPRKESVGAVPNNPYFSAMSANELMDFTNDMVAYLEESSNANQSEREMVLLECQLLSIKLIHDGCKNALGTASEKIIRATVLSNMAFNIEGKDYERFEFLRQQLIETYTDKEKML